MVCRGVASDECIKNCEKGHHRPKELSGVETRFFKIMFGEEDYSNVMYLPPKFAKTVQHLADQKTQLEDACGLRWSVTVSKVKGFLAFQKGWPKFFRDHGLEQGEFLTFKYTKGSHFVVRVYDKTACERLNFNNEMPRQNKRARRDQDTASEGEPFQIADVNSGDKPASATSVASGFEFQNCHANVAVTNADVGRMQLPVSMKMEDPICMINRDDEHLQQREDRNFLNDLSSFEIQNCALEPNKSQKVLNTKLDSSCGEIGSTEQTKTLGDDVHSNDIFTDKLEKSLDAEFAPSRTDSTERTITARDDGEMDVIQTNQINAHSGDIVAEKALEKNTVHSHAEITKQAIRKGDDDRMAAICPSQNADHSGATSMVLKKSLDAKFAPSHTDITERTKTARDDEMDVIQTNQINAHSGDIVAEKVLETKTVHSHSNITKQAIKKGDDDRMTAICPSQNGGHSGATSMFFKKSLDAKLTPSHTDITERTKTTRNDEMDVIQTNQFNAHSGEIVAEKPLETKPVHSYAEITKQAIKKDDDNRLAAICPSQNAGHFGATSLKKPSENIKLSKGMLDDVSIFQNESYSGSPSIGSSKIAEGLRVAKSRCHDSSVSSSVLKDPFVKHAIKKEQVEMEDQAYCFVPEAYGKEPTICNHDQKFYPAVKVEPDQSTDIGPLRKILPFSAEVKSKSYLELPPELESESLRGWRDRGRGKIVYLKDSMGRIWPVFFQDKYLFKAFTTNWNRFCDTNNIKPGDKCRFQVEKAARLQFRVDIFRTSNESPLK